MPVEDAPPPARPAAAPAPAGTELALLRRLVGSPFTRHRFWEERPRLGIEAGPRRWLLRDRGLYPPDGAPVDATLRCSADDLSAMLAGRIPAGTVSYALGERPEAPRRRQARALLALAALGWCGPWPAPDADPEHVRLLRAAHYDLGVGPCDGTARLLPEGGPLPHVGVRVTEDVRGVELVTDGLSDAPGRPEVSMRLPPRTDPRRAFPLLRAAALRVEEHGGLPRVLAVPAEAAGWRHGATELHVAPHPRFPDGLPLPNAATWLLRVG